MKREGRSTWETLVWLVREAFLLPLHLYRLIISPNLAPRCKYYPSCSTYGVQAVRELGVLRGSIVAAWRVLRCNPFSHGGVDELADRSLFPDRADHPQRPDHGAHDSEVAA